MRPADLREPLSQYQAGTSDNSDTYRLVDEIYSRLTRTKLSRDIVRDRFDADWSRHEQVLQKQKATNTVSVRLRQLQQTLPYTIDALRHKDAREKHSYFADVILKYVNDVNDTLLQITSDFDVPPSLYPSYLLSLLASEPVVRAIAVVDAVERFWPQNTGKAILRRTTPESTRIFVFRDPQHLTANLKVVTEHANRYKVHVFELHNRRRVSGILVGVDDPRRRMVLPPPNALARKRSAAASSRLADRRKSSNQVLDWLEKRKLHRELLAG